MERQAHVRPQLGHDRGVDLVAARLTDDRALPGFGHNLYPDGDPRAAALLDRFTPPPELARLQEMVWAITGQAANVDFALMAGCETLRLPKDAPFALFSIARCAGWIAHAIEQGQQDRLIRPRARYVGPEPESPA